MRRHVKLVSLALLSCLSLSGCQTLEQLFEPKAPPSKEELVQRDQAPVDTRLLANPMAQNNTNDDKAVMTMPKRPNGGVIGDATPVIRGKTNHGLPAVSVSEEPVELSFVDASLKSVIELLFDQYIHQPYTFLPDFKDQTVSWIVSGSYDKDTIVRMVESFLDLHGVNIIRQGDVYAISANSAKAAEDSSLGQTSGTWRLRYLDAKDVVTIGRQFLAKPDRLQVVDNANMVVAIGSGPEMRNLDKFLANIDVPALQDRNVMVYGPQYLSAQAIVSLLQNFPKALGMPMAGEGKKLVEAEVVTNAQRVVVITKGEEMRQAVLKYLSQVDQPGKDTKQVFVAPLRSQKASELRAVIEQVLTAMFQDRDKVTVVSDDRTNSLLVTSSADEYYQIRKVIDRLDNVAPSVLIESSIIEVQLTQSMAYGVEWFLSGRGGKVRGDMSTSLRSSGITITDGLAASGSTLGVVSLKDNTFATLDLLAAETSVQVLSRPRVLVKDQKTATIKSTKQVRVLKSELPTNVSTSGTTQISNQYEEKEVGVTLEVTPLVGSDGSITLKVKIEDSNQGAVDSATKQPTFDKREVNSEFVVAHGETVFIGGLIKRRNSAGTNKIPGFADIPILGNAFSNQSNSDEGSELLVLVTPYIVVDQYAARLVSEAFSGIQTSEQREKKK